MSDNKSIVQPFTMYGSSRNIYAETAFYRQFSKDIHCHDYYQCMIITKGSCVQRVDHQKTLLQVHDAFILPPNIPHVMDSPSNNLEFYQLAIQETFFHKLLRSQSMLKSRHIKAITEEGIIQNRLRFHISLTPVEYQSILSLMDCLILELSSPEDQHESSIVENITTSILMMFDRVLMNMDDLQKGHLDHLEKFRSDTIESILQYIDLNYAKPLKTEELAKQCSMSRSAFFENFYRVVGQSPHQYIVEKRISAAKQLLLDTYMTEAAIAACIGFRDLSTFHRNFVKICHCTPGQFRFRTKANASCEL